MNEILKKRIEEAAEKHSEEYRPDESLYGIGTQIGYLQGFLKGANYALTHQFISVKESLPENEEYVIALIEGVPVIAKGIYMKEHLKDIVAWMSIPKFNGKEVHNDGKP